MKVPYVHFQSDKTITPQILACIYEYFLNYHKKYISHKGSKYYLGAYLNNLAVLTRFYIEKNGKLLTPIED